MQSFRQASVLRKEMLPKPINMQSFGPKFIILAQIYLCINQITYFTKVVKLALPRKEMLSKPLNKKTT